MATWKPPVDKRNHPWGERGVLSSLDEVAKAASRGSTDPRVRTWAIETLDKAREKGAVVKHPHERARVLLEAVQKKLWAPDPIGAEYIPEAHLLACDPDKPKDGQVCVRGDDCDGLATLLGASLSAVGIYTLIVGHGYGENRIEHVLCAAHLPRLNVSAPWHYADPSTKLPLGRCVPFKRERLLSIPNVKVLCDGSACLGKQAFDPENLEFIDQGLFIGVGRLPELRGLSSRVVWEALGGHAPSLLEQAVERLRG